MELSTCVFSVSHGFEVANMASSYSRKPHRRIYDLRSSGEASIAEGSTQRVQRVEVTSSPRSLQ